MKSNLLARFATVALLCSSAALAQDQVAMKLDLVAWGPTIEGLSVKAGGKGEKVTAQAFTYSKPVAYSGSAVMEIHQDPAEAAKATEGSQNAAAIPAELSKLREKDPTIVAIAKLPPGSRRATVLIAPAQSGTYQTFVIDDDPSKLPYGQLRIHNYSPIKIAMRCNGKAQKEMKTKETFLVTPENTKVIYELAYDSQGQWEMQENNMITVPKDEQVQLIILKSDADFFTSSDGSRSGFLQTVTLRRPAKEETPVTP
jgi:hypothetical protein